MTGSRPGVRPTRGVLAALAAAAVLQLLARATGGAWLSLGAGAALALPVAALLLRPRLDLVVSGTPVRARVGDAVETVLVVRNAGRRPSPPVRLVDGTPGLSPLVVAVPGLAPGAEVRASVVREAVARGRRPAGQGELSSTAPFGLLRAVRPVALAGAVVVAPARTPPPSVVAGGEGAGALTRPVAGAGTEVLGLRTYRPGDPAAAVHARASARAGRPVVLERERETGPSLVLACLGPGRGPAWEATVAQGCALAEQAAREGRPPRLLATGLPVAERPDAAAVLDWCAGLDDARPLDATTATAAARAAGRGGAVVVLVPPGAPSGALDHLRGACTSAGARLHVLGGG